MSKRQSREMMKWTSGAAAIGRLALLAATACVVLVALPAVASAAKITVFVSNAPVKGPFTSCASPGYNSINEAVAINGPGTTIHVCAGTYKEQVLINKPDKVEAEAGATLEMPASPVGSLSSCDIGTQQDLVDVCGAGKVKVTGLTINGIWPAGCASDRQEGIYVAGGSALTLTGSKIVHAGPPATGECGGSADAVQIGRKTAGQTGSAKLSGDSIEGYDKNGITVDGPGSSAKISAVTIKGQPGVSDSQNGIQVGRGATAKISGVTVEGNECGAGSCGPNTSGFKGPEEWEEAEDATGILFYEGGSGSQVKGSTINGNDIGIYNLLNAGSATTTLKGNSLKGNRFWGIALDEGKASVSNNTIAGPGLAGIQIVQYAQNEQFHVPSRGQASGATGTGKSDTISGMTQCAVEGFSDSAPGDIAGSLTITKSLSKFSGNKTELCNNNTNGKLTISVS